VLLNYSAAVSVPLEVEVELQDPFIELALEAVSLLDLPLSVDDGKGNVFVRSAAMESDRVRILSAIGLDEKLRSDRLVK
jgi:hypothetical protein